MINRDELLSVRCQWKALARAFDRRTTLRYRLVPYGWRETLLARLADAQALLGIKHGFVPQGGWPVALKHAERSEEGTVVVLWALGSTRETIYQVCDEIARLEGMSAQFTPVLLTDVADFAYYARLGWLVEYLPNWTGPAARHREQKLAYLAWRYRHALVVPLSAAVATLLEWGAVP
ncbi:hypothetical protein [Paraburkholderia susongensis]|uniref:Uncharacterized protein n=1 Tax=Paraburkholderia susongensis TaxID=1515439 RepID=A0A1X7LSP9_9BURK|nr:hypothetical protein [Paraburkholderia susongensis]SMG56517.1 hypothetical protein SAMN06265784_108207 [Paraburkholderia susongensis]